MNNDCKALSPKNVASMLNIGYRKAKRLMAENKIKSWIETTTSDNREYLLTIEREVQVYQDRIIGQRHNQLKGNR